MYRQNKKRGPVKIVSGMIGVCLFLWLVRGLGQEENPSLKSALKQELANSVVNAVCTQFVPAGASFADESGANWLVRTQAGSLLPLYGMQEQAGILASDKKETKTTANNPRVLSEEMIEPTGQDTSVEIPDLGEGTVPESDEELWALMEQENQNATKKPFEPHHKRVTVDLDALSDFETLLAQFYTVDASTVAEGEQINIEALTEPDVTIDKEGDGPQILIYHTHSQEGFADSVPEDESTTIVGVGEHLAEILREQYGYEVLHHKGQYDVDTREDAYGKALPAVKTILEENPSIRVVIDLHRDQMPPENKLVMDLDGRPTARFMFFNGLSKTKKAGDIAYLYNENIAFNLALSFQMQLKCEEYYPGLTRKIYLKGYRYNMHLCPRTLLVELGAQNNTVEEAMNACDPLAHVLDMVLSGK